MGFKDVGIIKTRIKDAAWNFSFSKSSGFYTTDIIFDKNPDDTFKELTNINCGDSFNKAKAYHQQLHDYLRSVLIDNGSDVVVIFDTTSKNVIAFATPGSYCWIDVNDDFKVKQFCELKLLISGLSVC